MATLDYTDASPDMRELERLLDKFGPAQLVKGLAIICTDKAAHIEADWQDAALARVWARIANGLDTASRTFPLSELSRMAGHEA